MNKKGFAITGIIYAILVLFLALLAGILGLLANRKLILDKLKNDVILKLNNETAVLNMYKDNSGANIPEIYTNMIPITYQNGEWKYADVTTKWYDYDLKEWANAVVLNPDITKNVGDTILESDISLWYVWVPRYKYKIFNDGNYNGTIPVENKPNETSTQEIEIVFENKYSSKSTGTTVNSYLTHPAFTFGTKELNGIWVGKFESSNRENSITNNASLTLTIKPNVRSWTNVNIYNAFNASQNVSNIYGLENADSHMMKNTEWGAVAYLSHSKYGIDQETIINNASTLTTGCAAITPALNYYNRSQNDHSEGYYNGCENTYNTEIGVLASTTGNITGIYDMSGGALEYVSAYIDGIYGNSGFNSTSIDSYDNKYFDIYPSDSATGTYNKRILGDATGELGPFYTYNDSDNISRNHSIWYNDLSEFISYSYPWFNRGGYYYSGMLSGLFAISGYTGEATNGISFRNVLVSK